MRKIILSVALAGLVAGCAQKVAYIRIDGQRGSDPVLAQQFEIDRTICTGEMQKANVSGVTFTGGGVAGLAAQIERSNAVGQVAQGCMAQKGYVSVPEDQAEAKTAEFAAVAAEKKRREEAEASATQLALKLSQKKKQSTAAN